MGKVNTVFETDDEEIFRIEDGSLVDGYDKKWLDRTEIHQFIDWLIKESGYDKFAIGPLEFTGTMSVDINEDVVREMFRPSKYDFEAIDFDIDLAKLSVVDRTLKSGVFKWRSTEQGYDFWYELFWDDYKFMLIGLPILQEMINEYERTHKE